MSPVVQRARTVKQLFSDDVAGLKPYSSPDSAPFPLQFQLACSANELSKEDIEACLNLVEQTSGDDYRASSIGWNTRKKREEMVDPQMLYLLVRQAGDSDVEPVSKEKSIEEENGKKDVEKEGKEDASGKENRKRKRISDIGTDDAKVPKKGAQLDDLEQIAQGYTDDTDDTTTTTTTIKTAKKPPILGFTSFMFTWDDPPHTSREVLYIYEIHLSPLLRNLGLGTRLISFVESVARACSIEKMMLTVFTKNEGARRVYEKRGFERDECSPQDREIRGRVVRAEYEILSKMVVG